MSGRDFEPLPYYRWYWRDARASRRWQRLHYVARGLYRELMDECWARGGIPNDIAALADICGCPVKVMEKHWPALEAMFIPAGPNMLTSERIEQERTDMDRDRAAKSRAGIRSGESRREHKRTKTNSRSTGGNSVPDTRTSSSSSRAEQSSSTSARSRAGSPDGPHAPAPIAEIAVDWRKILRDGQAS